MAAARRTLWAMTPRSGPTLPGRGEAADEPVGVARAPRRPHHRARTYAYALTGVAAVAAAWRFGGGPAAAVVAPWLALRGLGRIVPRPRLPADQHAVLASLACAVRLQ